MYIRENIKYVLLGMLLVFGIQAKAQLSVQTTVLPPYSPYLSDYYGYQNKLTVRIVNPTGNTYQVKLRGGVTGGNIKLDIKSNYTPPNIINVPPGVTNLKGSQLSNYFTSNALSYSGITQQEIVSGNGLPEGNYKVCFWAVNYTTNQQLSTPNQGCANLTITHYEVPFLIKPSCNAEVVAKKPQNEMFSWTVPAGIIPSNVKYELTVVEVYPENLNANQAVQSATEPVFFRKIVNQNLYVYQLSDPKLEVGKTYAWRVRVLPKAGKKLNFKNNGYSVACKFKYVANQNNQEEEENNPPEDFEVCDGPCEIEAPTNKNPYTPKVGDDIYIGKFTMKISTINGASGTGVIKIPFLNVNVAVNFKNLQVNTEKQAFGTSEAVAQLANNTLIDQVTANDPDGEINLTAEKVKNIEKYITQGQKLVSKFNPDMEAIPLPFAQDNKGFNWDVLGLIFRPTTAYMNAVFGMEITDAFENDWVDMGMKGICIRPNGYGVMPKVFLKNDRVIPLSDNLDMVLKGNNSTYVVVSCNGIEKVHAAGELAISREKLLPHDGKKVIDGNTKVKALFDIDITKNMDWMVEATMQPSKFVLPDAKDVILTANTAILDQSDVQNSQNFKLHASHPKNAMDKDWKGLYIKTIGATLPSELKKKEDALAITLSDVVIDKTGLWVKADLENVVSVNEGSVANWSFSVNHFSLDVQASSLTGGSMEGGLKLPITEEALDYTAALSKGDENLNYKFSVTTNEDINADIWKAKLQLEPGSSVSIEKINGVVIPEAVLNGTISISFTESPDDNTPLSNLSLKKIDFQEMKITGGSKPEIDFAFVGLKSQPKSQHGMGKFPINLTELSYENNGTPGLVFGMGLNLTKGENGFKATTSLKIKGKYNPQERQFKYDGIALKSIGINAKMGVLDVEGLIDMYNEDETYGTGFRGDISATVKIIGVKMDATLQVGKIGNGIVENDQNFRYWFADLSVVMKTGIAVPGVPGIAFYGFSGGAFKNMDREAPEPISNAAMPNIKGKTNDMSAGKTRSGIVYTPKKGTLGFMAGVTFGTLGDPTAFNADLKLMVQFNTDDFGITKIGLDGKGYIMGPILNREKRVVEATVEILADVENKSFDANMIVDGGFDESKLNVSVAVALAIHASPGSWYVKLGHWTNDDEPWNDDTRIQVNAAFDAKVLAAQLNFNAYLMMGNDIGELPRAPLLVRNMLAQENKAQQAKLSSPLITKGTGFALGAGIKFDAELDYSVFYTDITFVLGADVILSKSNVTCNGKNDYGLNNWYAKGKAYAYFDVDAGIRLNMWLWKGEFSLVHLQTAAQVDAELPNPYYIKGQFALKGDLFNGLVKINTKYRMEVGEKCQWSQGQDINPLDIIEELKPDNGDKKSVFTSPQASFNFQLDKNLTFKDKKNKSKVIRFKLVSAKLKDGGKTIQGVVKLNNAKNGLTFTPNDTLPGKKDLTFIVKVKAEERKKGKWKLLRNEKREVTFKTDIAPDYIAEENVISAYPQLGQRYFLQDDQPKGDIRVGQSQCYLLNKTSDDNFTYSYKLQLTNLTTKKVTTIPFQCSGKHFSYNMPKLSNETVYEIAFLRVATNKNAKVNTKKNTKSVYEDANGKLVKHTPKNSGNKLNIQGSKLKFSNKGKVNKFQSKGIKLGGSSKSESSMLYKKNKVSFEQEKQGDITKVLFKYHFRTSKYNTSAVKYGGHYKQAGFGGMNYTQTYSQYTFNTPIHFPLIHGDENMDVYDAYGYYKKNGSTYVPPLVKMKIEWGGGTYYTNIQTKVYGFRYKSKPKKTADMGYLPENRYATYEFFGRNDLLFSKKPVEAIKIWNPYTEGPLNLKNNQKLLKPKKPLTKTEIAKAKAGHKLNETVGVNYVIPITDYSPAVVILDAIKLYKKHKDWCNSDHITKKNRKTCYTSYAKPLLGGSYLTYLKLNPYSTVYNNQKLNYKFSYGYADKTPFTKIFKMNFKTN